MQASKAPDTIDAESFASNLTLVKSLFPTMPEASVRRISWQVAKSRASLSDAVKEEGYSLDGTSAPLAAVRKPAPPVALTAAQAAELAPIRRDIHALRDGPAAPPPAAQPAAPVAVEKKPMTADDAGRLQVAATLMERAQLEGRATAATVAAFKQRAADAAAETVEDVNVAARKTMAENPKLSFFAAVQENSRGTK